MGLTLKQERWVTEYIRTVGNASEAARRAGYAEDSAAKIGHENTKKVHLMEEVRRRLDEQDVDASVVTSRFIAQAKGEAPTRWDVDAEGNVIKMRFDPHIALDKLARVKGLYLGEEDDRAVKVLIVRDIRDIPEDEFDDE